MNDAEVADPPAAIAKIWDATEEAGFTMPSDHQTGSLLRTLAASRRQSRILELGTGTGLSAAWLLDGMDRDSTLDSVDTDATVIDIARNCLGDDARLHLRLMDGADFLSGVAANHYDLIFADAWPGKYSHLDLAIASLKIGGIYLVDDMLPQPNWPDGHEEKAIELSKSLRARADLQITTMHWSTGLILATKVA